MFSKSQIAVAFVGGLHIFFLLGELLPWGQSPLIMNLVVTNWKEVQKRPPELATYDKLLLRMVVNNSGIYNGIVAAGLLATLASRSRQAVLPVRVALLTGGIAAGVFGGFTLTSAVFAQAAIGAVALGMVLMDREKPSNLPTA